MRERTFNWLISKYVWLAMNLLMLADTDLLVNIIEVFLKIAQGELLLCRDYIQIIIIFAKCISIYRMAA